jgi:hypothetical protein
MTDQNGETPKPVHDRALLLHGARRNEVLRLAEVEQYGLDGFESGQSSDLRGRPERIFA